MRWSGCWHGRLRAGRHRRAELELCLVDGQGAPCPATRRSGPRRPTRVMLEIDRFNLELNLTPAPLAGRPFAPWPASSTRPWDRAPSRRRHGGRVGWSGSCPPCAEDLSWRAVGRAAVPGAQHGLRRLRQEPFRIRIHGADPLELAATTSRLRGRQHLVPGAPAGRPGPLRPHFNAAQLAPAGRWPWPATPPPSSATGSGRRPGWPCSSRPSTTATPPGVQPAAVPGGFGTGWLAAGRWTARARACGCTSRCCRSSAPSSRWTAGEADGRGRRPWRSCGCTRGRCGAGTGPSTTPPGRPPPHRAARPASGADGDRHAGRRRLPARPHPGHGPRRRHPGPPLRLPAGPPQLLPGRQFGLGGGAGLAAGPRRPVGPLQRPSWSRAPPAAREGLVDAGVDPEEAGPLLAVVEARTETGQTGAAWQRQALAALEPGLGRARPSPPARSATSITSTPATPSTPGPSPDSGG